MSHRAAKAIGSPIRKRSSIHGAKSDANPTSHHCLAIATTIRASTHQQSKIPNQPREVTTALVDARRNTEDAAILSGTSRLLSKLFTQARQTNTPAHPSKSAA
jgi:hypothetical protein